MKKAPLSVDGGAFLYERALSLVGVRLEEGVEVAHGQIVAPGYAHVGDAFTILVESLYSGDNIVQVLAGQAAAVYCKAHDVADFGLLLGSFQIVFHRIVAELGNANAIAAN